MSEISTSYSICKPTSINEKGWKSISKWGIHKEEVNKLAYFCMQKGTNQILMYKSWMLHFVRSMCILTAWWWTVDWRCQGLFHEFLNLTTISVPDTQEPWPTTTFNLNCAWKQGIFDVIQTCRAMYNWSLQLPIAEERWNHRSYVTRKNHDL